MSDYKATQHQFDKKLQPKLIKGYKLNNYPNRAQRRAQAKKEGAFTAHNRGGDVSKWEVLFKGFSNVQTYVKEPQ